jgi:Spy/CpxP family protein refolding chaperone
MVKRSRSILLLASCSLVIVAGFGNCLSNSVRAQEPGPDPIAIYKEAGADEKQQEKILSLANQYEKEQDAKAHAVIENLKKLRALSLNPDLDEKHIFQAQSTINKLQSEMAMDKMRLLVSIRKILNSQQRVNLVSLMQTRMKPEKQLDPGAR